MTKDQLDTALASTAKDAGTAGQTFYIPGIFLQFVRVLLQKVVTVVAGQPNLAAPQSFAKLIDLLNVVSLLNYPANGYKLFLQVGVMRLAFAVLKGKARKMNGEPFQFDANGVPIE